MRNRGVRFECLRLRPLDHVGWAFSGQAEFAALAGEFLAEGAARGERLMYVTADPGPAPARLRDALGSDRLQVASVAEIYGASGIVDVTAQRATFAAALADALGEGFTGIRVAADNTPLVTDDRRMGAWTRWEISADRFMSENPVTGLCAFDRDKVDVNRLRHLAMLHPLSSADCPVPQFRLFSDGGNLCVEGQIDSSTVTELPVYLDVLPPGTAVLIDLADATLASRAALTAVGMLAATGVSVTIRGDATALGKLTAARARASENIVFQEVSPTAARPLASGR